MNFTLLSPSQRLVDWKELRESLKDKADSTVLNEIIKYWSKAPIILYSIDIDKPSEWPTPWELIYEGNFDSTSISFLMEQTLILSGWDPDRIRLSCLREKESNYKHMILVVDNQYVLNYSFGEIYPLDKLKEEILFSLLWNGETHIKEQNVKF